MNDALFPYLYGGTSRGLSLRQTAELIGLKGHMGTSKLLKLLDAKGIKPAYCKRLRTGRVRPEFNANDIISAMARLRKWKRRSASAAVKRVRSQSSSGMEQMKLPLDEAPKSMREGPSYSIEARLEELHRKVDAMLAMQAGKLSAQEALRLVL